MNLLYILVAVFGMVYMGGVDTASAVQTVPYRLNFQGKLTDSSGNAVANGLYNLRFRIADAPSGGSVLWTETHDETNRIQVTNGLFNAVLGGITSLGPVTTYPLYLEVELPTPGTATCATAGCASWSEGAMTPRTALASAAYAMNADRIDGVDGAALAQLSATQTFTGTNTFTGTFLHKPTSDSTTAFQIQKSDNSPLLVGDTTNMRLKIGGGDTSPNANPALLVLDYKSSSGDPTGLDGAMYYNNATGKLRCRENGAWKDCQANIKTRFEHHNDFTIYYVLSNGNNIGDNVLSGRTGNSGGSFIRLAGELNHPGIMRFQAGNFLVSGNVAFVSSSLDTIQGIQFGSGIWANNVMLRIPIASDNSNTFTTYNGFYDGATAASISPANGCYLRYTSTSSQATNVNWRGVCRNANTETTCDTGIPVSSTTATHWFNLSTTVNAAGSLATFVVDNITNTTSGTCTVSANIPTTNKVSIGAGLTRSAGGTARNIDYDYIETVGEGLVR